MELPPALDALAAVLGRCPLAFSEDAESAAVDDEVGRPGALTNAQRHGEARASARHGGVVGNVEAHAHQLEDGPQESLGLAKREMQYPAGLARRVRAETADTSRLEAIRMSAGALR